MSVPDNIIEKYMDEIDIDFDAMNLISDEPVTPPQETQKGIPWIEVGSIVVVLGICIIGAIVTF